MDQFKKNINEIFDKKAFLHYNFDYLYELIGELLNEFIEETNQFEFKESDFKLILFQKKINCVLSPESKFSDKLITLNENLSLVRPLYSYIFRDVIAYIMKLVCEHCPETLLLQLVVEVFFPKQCMFVKTMVF